MKKTHSANIGGTVFIVEDDAYEHLQAYLHSIELHFRSYPDVAEIVADIEGRIAEQLMQREMTPQVVRLVDVERVIAAMGRIEEFDEQAEGPSAAQQSPGTGRKLFRDPDSKVIAGVAGGLAAYLGLPPLVVRVMFLVLAFFFGTSVVVYLLLWVLVPVASSTTDKLQMRGRPLTLAAIDQGVRDGLGPLPAAARNVAAQGITAAGSLIHLVVVAIARTLKWIVGVFVVGVASVGVLFLTVALVVALVNASAPPLPSRIGAEFFANFGSWQHAFKVLVYLVAAIPLAVIIATALRLFWRVTRLNSRGLAGLLGVWVIALLGSAAIWSGNYPAVREYMDDYPVISQARERVEIYRDLVAMAAPLTDEQADALFETLVAEYRRRFGEDATRRFGQNQFPDYSWRDPLTQLETQERTLQANEDSVRRVIESARAYLDAKQIELIEDSLERSTTAARERLQEQRERLQEQRERLERSAP
jgi:phage shock protein PspC (stress-responsive transcriptional regulator)